MTQEIKSKTPVSIILPVFNEELGVHETITKLISYCEKHLNTYEIITVDDGSTDNTLKKLKTVQGIRIVEHPYNKGYGAALKTGVSHAKYEWVLFFDADGQHKPEYISKLLSHTNAYDMVVGAREGYKGPLIRQPGKNILLRIACFAVQYKIPDLNSGLRAVKKELFWKFEHLYPAGFSLSTTITLAFIKQALHVKFVPIRIEKRTGKSTVKLSDGYKALNLILRIIMLFSPMRFFVPVALIIFALGTISLGSDVVHKNLTDTTTLLFLTSVIIGSFGLLADQVASIRREIHR